MKAAPTHPVQVESLKRSVLEAKRDVAASGFFAALMAALDATNSADSDADEPWPAPAKTHGHTHRPGGVRHGGSAATSSQRAPPQNAEGGPGTQRQRAEPEGSQGSGSSGGGSMAVDQTSAGSPMATDGPGSPPHDAAADDQLQQLHNPSAVHVNGGSPTSYAAAAKAHLHGDFVQQGGVTPAADQGAAQQHGHRRWRWADSRELVVYGLGSFESGERTARVSTPCTAAGADKDTTFIDRLIF